MITYRLEWPGMVSEYTLTAAQPTATVTRPHQIGIGFSGHHRLVRETAGHVDRGDVGPGAVYVTGDQPITWLEVQDPTEALEIYPRAGLVEGLAGGPVEIRPALAVRDGTVFAVASRLRRAHLSLDPLTDVEASTLCHLLLARLVDVYTPVRRVTPGAGRLPAGAVDVVHEYVRSHLDEPLSLETLAATVSSSPFHFARSFKAATGTTPHSYVTEIRMTVARDLLVRSGARVVDAATAVGMSNLGHFRRLFRRQFGVGPGTLRTRLPARKPQDPTPFRLVRAGMLAA
jgi:AraC family transcriptional regulator